MFGKARPRFTRKDTPAVWVLVEIERSSNARYVTVFMHEHCRKIYTKFECRKFGSSVVMNKYIASLGEGVLIMVVEK